MLILNHDFMLVRSVVVDGVKLHGYDETLQLLSFSMKKNIRVPENAATTRMKISRYFSR